MFLMGPKASDRYRSSLSETTKNWFLKIFHGDPPVPSTIDCLIHIDYRNNKTLYSVFQNRSTTYHIDIIRFSEANSDDDDSVAPRDGEGGPVPLPRGVMGHHPTLNFSWNCASYSASTNTRAEREHHIRWSEGRVSIRLMECGQCRLNILVM